MGNDFQKDGLHVEQYDAAKAETKRKKILKRVGIGVGAAVLLAVLGYFGLVKEQPKSEPDTPPGIESVTEPTITPMTEFMLGGNGAWFNSVIIFFGG